MLSKIRALVKKDFLIESSYTLSFVMDIVSVIAGVLTFYYIDKLFGYTITGQLHEYGVSYFPYVLVSMACFNYIGVGLAAFSARIRYEQLQGTLESLLMTPTKIPTLLAGLSLWNFICSTFNIVLYIGIGIIFLHIRFEHINFVSTLCIIVLSMLCFSCMGIISAAFIVVFKRGNPFGWFLNTAAGLLGGVYFPVSVMPHPLQTAAKFFPITYAIRALELAIHRGYTLAQLKNEVVVLTASILLLIPVSLSLFAYSLNRAKKDGALTHY